MSRSLIPNSTQIPDVILDHWMAHLSGAEFKIVMYIARRTYGFGKESDTISLNQLARGIRLRSGGQLDYGTGLSRSSVKAACASLVGKGILVKTQALVGGSDEPDENTYRLNLYAPITLEGGSESDGEENQPAKKEVGQKLTHVGQKLAHPRNRGEVGQKSAQGRPKTSREVGQKLAPQETVEQETDLQETAAADTALPEPYQRQQKARGNAAADSIGKSEEESKPETVTLIEALLAADLNRVDAERLARTKPEEARRQLEYLPFKINLENPGGYLRSAIEGGFPPPKEYKAAKAQEERERKKRIEAAQKQAREASQRAVEAAEALRVDDSIAQLKIEAPEAFVAFSAYIEVERQKVEVRYSGMRESIRAKMLQSFDTPTKRRELFATWQALPESQKTQIPETQAPALFRYEADKQQTNGRARHSENPDDADQATIASLVQSSLGVTAG